MTAGKILLVMDPWDASPAWAGMPGDFFWRWASLPRRHPDVLDPRGKEVVNTLREIMLDLAC